jgi:hypothetical protein
MYLLIYMVRCFALKWDMEVREKPTKASEYISLRGSQVNRLWVQIKHELWTVDELWVGLYFKMFQKTRDKGAFQINRNFEIANPWLLGVTHWQPLSKGYYLFQPINGLEFQPINCAKYSLQQNPVNRVKLSYPTKNKTYSAYRSSHNNNYKW